MDDDDGVTVLLDHFYLSMGKGTLNKVSGCGVSIIMGWFSQHISKQLQ